MNKEFVDDLDIDYSQKEIYETSGDDNYGDEVTISTLTYENLQENTEEIEFQSVRDILGNSRRIFENNFISDINNVDFSGRIDKATTFESFKVNETYDLKLKRIRRELEELQTLKELPVTDSRKMKYSLQPTKDIEQNELVDLLNLLQIVESDEKHSPTKSLSSFQSEIKIKPKIIENTPTTNDIVPYEEVKLLENRIYRLEKLIGSNGLSSLSNSDLSKNAGFRNIESIINDLERKFRMLLNIENNEYSEKVSIGNENNISQLLSKMEALNKEITFKNKKLSASQSYYLGNESKSSKTDNIYEKNFIEKEELKKVDILFELLSQFRSESSVTGCDYKDITADIVRGLIRRLESLNSLFLEYSSAMNISKDSNNILSTLKEGLEKWQDTLHSANENLKLVIDNMENLNSRAQN